MSNEIAKEVLRNAIWKAAETIPIHELQGVLTETLHAISVEYVNIRSYNDDEDFHSSREKAREEDAKEIDDAQRYRDLKR